MAIFQVTVQTATSQPIPGAALRLFSPNGVDITASRLGASPVETDANGVLSRFFATIGPDRLPIGVYTIQASKSGYVSKSVETSVLFVGTGSFVIELTPIANDPEDDTGGTLISGPVSSFVSPMAPVEAVIAGSNSVTDWEYIEATVTSAAGDSSVLEVPVVGGNARINLQARLEREPLLQLIPDAANGIVDNAFSEQMTVTLASLTATGTRPLEGGFSVWVANAFPSGETNDLSNFTNTTGLADWLTPWEELPKFAGHPADAALWLPVPAAGPYALQIAYLNINRAALTQTSIALPTDLFATGQVVKLRIPEPVDAARYARLTVTLAGVAQTKPLNVHYNG